MFVEMPKANVGGVSKEQSFQLLTPKMASNSQSGVTLTGAPISSSTYDYYKAFNRVGNPSSDYYAPSNNSNSYIVIEFSTPACVRMFGILVRNAASYKLSASEDGNNYTDIGTINNLSDYETAFSTDIDNNVSYKYYKVTKTAGSGSGIGEIYLMG